MTGRIITLAILAVGMVGCLWTIAWILTPGNVPADLAGQAVFLGIAGGVGLASCVAMFVATLRGHL